MRAETSKESRGNRGLPRLLRGGAGFCQARVFQSSTDSIVTNVSTVHDCADGHGVLATPVPCKACRKILLVARSVTLALSCLGISLGQPTREYMALPSDGSAPSGLRLGTMLRSDA